MREQHYRTAVVAVVDVGGQGDAICGSKPLQRNGCHGAGVGLSGRAGQVLRVLTVRRPQGSRW
ncbi:Uncharacterised protein [Mycobacteroides abscessus subsp. abscessus]|nr:Uncharacterised protein [Mycobacteroides abscessus subsp. abscessus]